MSTLNLKVKSCNCEINFSSNLPLKCNAVPVQPSTFQIQEYMYCTMLYSTADYVSRPF